MLVLDRVRRRALGAALLAVAVALLRPGPAAAGGGCGPVPGEAALGEAEQQLLALTNGERTSRGLAPLSPRSSLVTIARPFAATMAAAGTIWHNDAFFAQIESLDAQLLAENVGKACGVKQVHEALMQSPKHRANILHPELTHAGYGAAADASGYVYFVQDFGAFAAAAPPPPPVAPVKQPPPPTVKPTPAMKPVRAAVQPTAPPPSPVPATPVPTAKATPAPTAKPTPVPAPPKEAEAALTAAAARVPLETTALGTAMAALAAAALAASLFGGRRRRGEGYWEEVRATLEPVRP